MRICKRPTCCRFLLGLCVLAWLTAGPLAVAQPSSSSEPNSAAVAHYDLTLQPDPETKRINGTLSLKLQAHPPASGSALVLNIGNLAVESVDLTGSEQIPLDFEIHEKQLLISLPEIADASAIELLLTYQGAPTFGLQFSDDGNEISTAFSTEQWMPVQNTPSHRASFSLNLIVPETYHVIATGDFVSTETVSSELNLHRWEEYELMPAYLFGFSAGVFREVIDTSAQPLLRFVAPPNFSESDLANIFGSTRQAIRFFEDRAGIAYPDAEYTQVLLRRGYGQELNGISVMRETYGRAVLEDPTSIWLGIHELAHQWWGNRVTNAEWTHFWLNEGIASFMTAAFFESHFGQNFYDELIRNSQESYERLLQEGHDKALVFPDWNSPSREDRSLVYDKGAYVVHLLRRELGDKDFWSGIRLYTNRHWQDSVLSADFQMAMEEASGKDLNRFFNQWVFE
jgi:aminopeptidase N